MKKDNKKEFPLKGGRGSNLPLKGDGGSGVGGGSFFGACHPLLAPILYLSRKKPKHTSRCSTPCYVERLLLT